METDSGKSAVKKVIDEKFKGIENHLAIQGECLKKMTEALEKLKNSQGSE